MKQLHYTIIFVLITWVSHAQSFKLSHPETGIKLVSENANEILVQVDVSEFNTDKQQTPAGQFLKLTIPGFTYSGKFGQPQLPTIYKLIEIPQEASIKVDVVSADVEFIDFITSGITEKVYPNQAPVSKSVLPKDLKFQYEATAYNQNQYSNNGLAEVELLGESRGTRLGRLKICPFEYNPVTNRMKVYKQIKVKVQFVGADIDKTEEVKKVYGSDFFNTPAFNTLQSNHQKTNGVRSLTGPDRFVIVSDPAFKAALQPFVKWKTKKGFKVIEAYTDDPAVGKTTTTIKNYLKGLYTSANATNPAPVFLLLVGDVANIPAFSGKTDTHYTDLYYGEYTGDYLPELFYGRFSATTAAQVTAMVDKTLMYEQYLMPDPSYLKSALLVSGVDASFATKHGNGQINYISSTYVNAAHDFTPTIYLYPASGNNASNIISKVNAGVSLYNYTAHGLETGFGDPSFSVTTVNSMTNAKKYGLLIGNCCLTNKFDYGTCFGEALLRKSNGGAIGYIGASNTSTWDEDYWWAVGSGTVTTNPTYQQTGLGAYDLLFHDHNEPDTKWKITNGQVVNAGNLAVVAAGSSDANRYWEIYHLMGDPSLMSYMSVPKKMTVTHNATGAVGTTSLTVKAEQYAYAAVSLNGVLLDAKHIDASGSVTLNFPAINTASVVDVVVTKQFKEPYVGTYTVGGTSGIAQQEADNSLFVVSPVESKTLKYMIYLSNENTVDVQVFSIDGKLVKNERLQLNKGRNDLSMDLNSCESGVYFVKVTGKAISSHSRIFVSEL